MITLDVHETFLNYSEEYKFNTKIIKSQNGKEYRKNLMSKMLEFYNLNFSSLNSVELQKLNNIFQESIDNRFLYKKYESNLISDINSGNNTLIIKYDLKFTKTYFKNILGKSITLTDNFNKETFSVNNVIYNNDNIIITLSGNVLNTYLTGSKVYMTYLREIQNKTISFKEQYKKFGEVGIKIKIINKNGERL